MATYVLQNSAQQIDQAVGAAYSGLIVAGTGIVRSTGAQEISGVKSFQDLSYFESGAVFSGSSSFEEVALANAVASIAPTGDNVVNLGSEANRFATGWFDTVTGSSGVIGGDLTVLGTLYADIVPAVTLDGAQGNNFTLSGTTNLVTGNFSGDVSVAGLTTLSGNLNVSGNALLNGTITATGNKTFSGAFSQSGSSSFFGAVNHVGDLISTGNWSHTGTLYQSGNITFDGTLNHTGQAYFDNSYSDFKVSGVGGTITIYSPTTIVGDCDISGQSLVLRNNIYHSGSISQTGNVFITGNATISGNTTIIGASNFSGQTIITGNTFVKSGALNLSGNDSSPSAIFNNNITTAPSGGALEYNRSFFATTEITGAPNRALVNQTFNYLAPRNFWVTIPSNNVTYKPLNLTGIYLNTGRYNIKYDIQININDAGAIRLGITGNHITNRVGTLASVVDNAGTSSGQAYLTAFEGDSLTQGILIYAKPTIAADPSFYSFNGDITITGLSKISPIVLFEAANSKIATGVALSMHVTQLATGTGVGLVGASGPWSDE